MESKHKSDPSQTPEEPITGKRLEKDSSEESENKRSVRREEKQERTKGGEDQRVKKCFLVLGAAERSVRLDLRSIHGV